MQFKLLSRLQLESVVIYKCSLEKLRLRLHFKTHNLNRICFKEAFYNFLDCFLTSFEESSICDPTCYWISSSRHFWRKLFNCFDKIFRFFIAFKLNIFQVSTASRHLTTLDSWTLQERFDEKVLWSLAIKTWRRHDVDMCSILFTFILLRRQDSKVAKLSL